MLQLFDHPHIITALHSIVRPDLKSCIVFPLAVCSLEDLIYSEDYAHLYQADQLVDWLSQLCTAFSDIHACGVIHFDLKPSNVLVFSSESNKHHRKSGTDHERRRNLIFKVTDFATSYKQTALKPGITSTPQYTAPEMLTTIETEFTEKVDVFAFGILAWETLHRRIPFGESTKIIEVLDRISRTDMPEFDPALDVSIGLQDTITSCWTLNPSERPSFDELSVRLEAIPAR